MANEQGDHRVYSGEFEYGILYMGTPSIPDDFFKYLPYGLSKSAGNDMRQNGSRIYPDCGHIEYAMPECGTLDDYVHADIAGEEIMQETLTDMAQRGPNRSFRLQKRGIDSLGTNYGAHESYNVLNSLRFRGLDEKERQYNIAALAALYSVRMVVAGGGYFNPYTKQWFVSQRNNCYNQLTSTVCHNPGSRPLVDTRDEPFADERYRRLHVSCGDPNVSPWALRTKVGLTSAYLRLLESGMSVRDLFLNDPLQTATIAAGDTALRATFTRTDGTTVSALNQLEAISEKILAFADDGGYIADDELAVVQSVHEVSIAAKEDPNALLYKADWKTRMVTAEKLAEKKAKTKTEYYGALAQADLHYDALAVKKGKENEVLVGYGKQLRDKGRFGTYDRKEVERLKREPPRTSRALLRGRLIEASHDEEVRRRYGHIRNGYWDTISFAGLDRAFDLSDPKLLRPNRVMRRILRAAQIEWEPAV